MLKQGECRVSFGRGKPHRPTAVPFLAAAFVALALCALPAQARAAEDPTPLAVGAATEASGQLQAASAASLQSIAWERLWGQTALDTMEAIVKAGDYPRGGTAVLVTANGFWDALTSCGIAGLSGAPVIMTDGMGVATSGGYWDALAGAALCGRNNSVIVLVDGPESSTITSFIDGNAARIGDGFIFGGPAAVSYSTELALNGQPYDKWSTLFRTYRDDPTVNQLLFVQGTGGTGARIELYQKRGDSWACTLSCQGWVGKNGIGETREGRSITPEGDFGITSAFGVKPSPGTELSYLQVNGTHYWCSDSNYYNQLIDITESPHNCAGEHLIDYPTAYEYGLFFDYNTDPVVYGAGSAFFVHCKINASYTAGCVMMARENMISVIQSLSPGARVCIHYQ